METHEGMIMRLEREYEDVRRAIEDASSSVIQEILQCRLLIVKRELNEARATSWAALDPAAHEEPGNE